MEEHLLDEQRIKDLGYKIVDILAREVSNGNSRPSRPLGNAQEMAETLFGGSLPEEGCSPESLLEIIEHGLLPLASSHSHSGLFCHISGGALPFPSLVEALVAGLRLYTFNSTLSPASNQIEVSVVQWLSQFIGYGDTAAGYVATGGTSANLMGLLTARVAQLGTDINHSGVHGEKLLTAYTSEYVHECMEQSMRIMGLGSDQLRKIPVDNNFKIRIDLLEQEIVKDLERGNQPFCIIGVAGVTATGTVDDLNALADLAEKYELWFHVDGAYGAFAASLPSHKALFSGIERADSLICDPHKWLNVPLEAGVVMVKDWKHLRETFAINVDCMASMNGRQEHNQWQHGYELSRRDRALKIWLAIKQHGAASYRKMFLDHMQLTQYMAEKIKASPLLELVMEPALSVCCFRYVGEHNELTESELSELNEAIEVRMGETGGPVLSWANIANKTVLRACIVSYKITQESVDMLIDTVIETGRECSRTGVN